MEILEFGKKILFESVSIFTIMNPISAGVIMLTLIPSTTPKSEITSIAKKNSKAVLISMLLMFAVGTYLFEFFGISQYALQVFGGLILLLMAVNMVRGQEKKVNHGPGDHQAALEQDDIAVVPMAIPIIVGPGLATTIIAMSTKANSWQDYLAGALALVVCSLANYAILKNMHAIQNRLGGNGIKVLNRVMGVIVGSLAGQMMVQGIFSLVKSYT